MQSKGYRLVPVEREIHSEHGRWYLTRTLPYRTTDNRIEGVVAPPDRIRQLVARYVDFGVDERHSRLYRVMYSPQLIDGLAKVGSAAIVGGATYFMLVQAKGRAYAAFVEAVESLRAGGTKATISSDTWKKRSAWRAQHCAPSSRTYSGHLPITLLPYL